MRENPDWMVKGRCRTGNPDDYSVDGVIGNAKKRQVRARELCAGCPVMAECAQDALHYGDWLQVRGSVALCGKEEVVLPVLQYVAEHGCLPPVVITKKPPTDDRCVDCTTPLRPHNTIAALYPGTARRRGPHGQYCDSCWLLKQKRQSWVA